MKPGSAFRFPQLTLVQHLLILSLTVLLPQALLGALIAWRYTDEQRNVLEQTATVMVRERTASLDRELEGVIGALQALATSPLIDQQNFERFRSQALELLTFRGTAVIMRDHNGRHIINTLQPAGAEALVSTDTNLLATDADVFRTKAPAVSNIYIGAVTKLPFVNVAVPVIRDDEVRFVLAIALAPAALSERLLANVPEGWIGGIFDRNLRIIARSRDQERFVGQFPNQPNRFRLVGESGTFHGGRSLDGAPVFSTFQRSAVSGWIVSFAIPEEMLNAPLRDLWRTLLIMSLLAIALSMSGAYLSGRILRRGLGMLARSARAVGREDFIPSGPTAVIEMNEVSKLLAIADADLKQKDAHQRTLLHELDHRVKNTLAIIQSLVTQTFRGSSSPGHFRDAIIGRIMALARSHEVLSAANWKDPELASVAEAVLARESARIHIEGDRLSLEPRVVVAFAQIFPELLVNAERHGALARPDGRVNLSWRREGGKLHLLWVETSSKPSDIESLQGLGTTIIRICIERQLGGVCRFEPEAAGLRFAATIPLHSDLGANAAVIEGPGKAGQGGASHNADLSPRP